MRSCSLSVTRYQKSEREREQGEREQGKEKGREEKRGEGIERGEEISLPHLTHTFTHTHIHSHISLCH